MQREGERSEVGVGDGSKTAEGFALFILNTFMSPLERVEQGGQGDTDREGTDKNHLVALTLLFFFHRWRLVPSFEMRADQDIDTLGRRTTEEEHASSIVLSLVRTGDRNDDVSVLIDRVCSALCRLNCLLSHLSAGHTAENFGQFEEMLQADYMAVVLMTAYFTRGLLDTQKFM